MLISKYIFLVFILLAVNCVPQQPPAPKKEDAETIVCEEESSTDEKQRVVVWIDKCSDEGKVLKKTI